MKKPKPKSMEELIEGFEELMKGKEQQPIEKSDLDKALEKVIKAPKTPKK